MTHHFKRSVGKATITFNFDHSVFRSSICFGFSIKRIGKKTNIVLSVAEKEGVGEFSVSEYRSIGNAESDLSELVDALSREIDRLKGSSEKDSGKILDETGFAN